MIPFLFGRLHVINIDLSHPIYVINLELVSKINKDRYIEMSSNRNIADSLVEQFLSENRESEGLLIFADELDFPFSKLIE